MTRRAELEEKCRAYYTRNFPGYDPVDGLPGLIEFVSQVERECWEKMEQKVTEQGDFDTPPFDDWAHGYEKACKQIADWCRAQKEGV